VKFRVLHLNTERGWRGGERQTLWLARELERRGHVNGIAARPGAPLAEAARREGLPVLPLNPFFEFDPFAVRRLRWEFARAGTQLLHAHTGHAVGLGALASRRAAVKFIATRRVDFPLKNSPWTRWKYRRLDALAAISSKVRDVLLTGGVPGEKINLIPSGVDPARYPSAADRVRLRSDRGFGPADLLIVHAGALVSHKDQATLIRAFAALLAQRPGACLLLLGDGPLRGPLGALARNLRVAASVSFLGHRTDVLEYTALADLFVFSSAEEGLGTALLDAFVLGVPTAATAAGGIPDLYGGPGAPELSPARDPKRLAENMERVLGDPAEARRRVERGRETARKFSVTAMADAYEQLYERVVGR